MGMRYIELFAGVGGMGYGLMQAGHECVGYAECDTKCETCGTFTQQLRSKKKQFYTSCAVCGREKKQPTHESFHILHDPEGRMWNAYDVTTVTDDDLRLLGDQRGPVDLIAGGFPCQAFSIAGKRKGFQDSTRGTLFFEIIRFASILRPKYVLLENVTGLLSHDGGRTFETVIRTLDELGYVGEWCVLNSAAYVPQNRERVFIVASLGGSGGRKVFPFGAEVQADAKQFSSGEGIAYCLDTGYAKGITEGYMNKGRRTMIIQKARGNNKGGLHSVAPTMTSNSWQDNNHLVDGDRIRRLTPHECFRLQSFPDEWVDVLRKAGISDTQLYKMAGNAVTSKVAYEIGRRLTA